MSEEGTHSPALKDAPKQADASPEMHQDGTADRGHGALRLDPRADVENGIGPGLHVPTFNVEFRQPGGEGLSGHQPHPQGTRLWAKAWASGSALAASIRRFLFPDLCLEWSNRFRIGFPHEYGMGVDTRWKDEHRIWIVRNATGIHAVIPGTESGAWPLVRIRIGLAEDGQIVVDKDKTFRYEKGEWDQPESYLEI